MVATASYLIKQRRSVLQLVGLPFVQWAIHHTYVMMWILRIAGIAENGVVKSGKLPMELAANIQGRVGGYKIRFWSCPVYRDCARWSLCVVKL